MKDFNIEEMNLLCIIKGYDREDTINNLFEVIPYINDKDIKQVAERLIGILDGMTDAEYSEISFDFTIEE
ncbi:transposon-transfer assisting family protein [Ruminococcus sp.]|uniref:transposon-transfer assisting family protein n=1 Tax=Ruminococcus sp. TaxID=41978 RepID=UPI001B4C1C3B|nr:transposon-transfer assisting family protein [Ruminococcus sp.]MBP5432256.1 transposon-transfer assisting family protein [Ruminococcus sp.]